MTRSMRERKRVDYSNCPNNALTPEWLKKHHTVRATAATSLLDAAARWGTRPISHPFGVPSDGTEGEGAGQAAHSGGRQSSKRGRRFPRQWLRYVWPRKWGDAEVARDENADPVPYAQKAAAAPAAAPSVQGSKPRDAVAAGKARGGKAAAKAAPAKEAQAEAPKGAGKQAASPKDAVNDAATAVEARSLKEDGQSMEGDAPRKRKGRPPKPDTNDANDLEQRQPAAKRAKQDSHGHGAKSQGGWPVGHAHRISVPFCMPTTCQRPVPCCMLPTCHGHEPVYWHAGHLTASANRFEPSPCLASIPATALHACMHANTVCARPCCQLPVTSTFERDANDGSKSSKLKADPLKPSSASENRGKGGQGSERRFSRHAEPRAANAEQKSSKTGSDSKGLETTAHEAKGSKKASEEMALNKVSGEKASGEQASKKETEEKASKKASEEKASKKVSEKKASKREREEKASKKETEEKAAREASEEHAPKKDTEEKASKNASEEKASMREREEKASKNAAEGKAPRKAGDDKVSRKAPEEKASKKRLEATGSKASDAKATKSASLPRAECSTGGASGDGGGAAVQIASASAQRVAAAASGPRKAFAKAGGIKPPGDGAAS
eukprot:354507-Chlamydomonas_euryale.AAC.10